MGFWEGFRRKLARGKSYTEQSNDFLIQQWMDNEDIDAFNELFERHRRDILSFASRKLDKDKDDVFQYCVLVFLENPNLFKNKNNLKAYFLAIAHNYIKKQYLYNNKHLILDEKIELNDELVSEDGYEDKIIWQEHKEVLWKAIDSLPTDYKTVFYLLIEQNLKPREIATVLECDPKKVTNIINRGYKRLRENLRDKREENYGQ